MRESLPSLMSAAVYADKLTVVTFEADTLVELADFHPIVRAFGGFFDCIGADSYGWRMEDPGSGSWDMDDDDADVEDSVFDQLWIGLAKRRLKTETDPEKKTFLESGIREREPSVEAAERARELAVLEEEVSGVLRIVEELLAEPNVFPFIYDPDAVLLADSIELGRLSRPSKKRLEADARLGAGIVDKLPSFDKLNAQEIVAVRAELRDLLIPFRGYVSEASVALTEVGRDEEAIADVIHEVYVGKVRPVLNDLNDMVSRSRFLRTLLRESGRDPKGFATSFITFGLGNLVHLPKYVAASAAASTELLRVKYEASAKRHEARSNRLYYLHELERRIEGR